MPPPVASGKHFIFTQSSAAAEEEEGKMAELKHFDISCLLQLILMGEG